MSHRLYRPFSLLLVLWAAALTACATGESASHPFEVTAVATFDEPWAMAFLPDGHLLVTEKPGRLLLVNPATGSSEAVSGVPAVDYGGQGGFGDVVLHPGFHDNGRVYVSYVEAGPDGTRGAAVASATLVLDDAAPRLDDLAVIWRQQPKVSGRGHYGHRMAFDDDGYLFISSGERQKFDPAQDMGGNLGKILRLNDDGSLPPDNPFADQGGVAAQVWSLGHRNPLGLAFDEQGRLWNTEMGPKHGDELNLVLRGRNYGYPVVSNGDHYSGERIPDHDTRPDLEAPRVWWDPTVAPAGLVFYRGEGFPDWTGSALIAGLASEALIRVVVEGDSAREVERFEMDRRIREVALGADGSVWLLEDGDEGRLLRLTPGH